ncbi:MAG TPA: hypothetical protein DHV30_14235 [Balneola sp.]|nr:hypothetical protein [Balneola sp.]|tara:strand:+ start:350 stop:622 length:273 start_codon:yes stop_codon:yes gene_type:complete
MSTDKSFGSLVSKKFSIGDIVEWSTWDDVQQDWNHNYGIITSTRNEIRQNRLVSITTVVPLQGPKKEIEHFSLSLRLVSKTGVKIENVNS